MKIKTFLLCDIVKIDYGNKFDLQKMTFDMPSVNFVSRTALNNGISAKVDLIPDKLPYNEGCLTIALGGSIGATFYQNKPFYTGQNVAVLQFKENVSILSKLYLCQIIKFEVKNKFRAFGRELNKHIKTDFTVNLPSNDDGAPDWDYMDRYMQTMHYKNIESNNYRDDYRINLSNWKEFKIADIFSCSTTKAVDYEELIPGETNYITRSSLNNGISGKIELIHNKLEMPNCITIGAEGKIAFYQNVEFLPGVKVYTLRNQHLNKYNALFIVTILNMNCFRYSYGRARTLECIKNEIIFMPVKNNQPDWEYMENYIKSLPYGDRI